MSSAARKLITDALAAFLGGFADEAGRALGKRWFSEDEGEAEKQGEEKPGAGA